MWTKSGKSGVTAGERPVERAHYIIRGGVQGRERLRILSRVMRPTTLALFDRVGIRSGMACLDVGCGGGDVTFDLARIVGTEGRIVGTDIDGVKLELARQEAEAQRLGNIEFRLSDIRDGQADPQFDVAYARYLLTHLKDRLGALATMHRALRPRGVVVVEDTDYTGNFCYPDCPAFRRFCELYSQAAQSRGGDPNIGPRLPGLLLDVGFERVQMSIVQPAGIEGEVKLIPPLTMECIADCVVADGLASRAEVDQIIAELHEFARDTRTIVAFPRVVQAWGYRARA
jgi:SAM-dependent methyltransferase